MAQTNAELEARILQIEFTYITAGQISKTQKIQDFKIEDLSVSVDNLSNSVDGLRSSVAPLAASRNETDSYLHTQASASTVWVITHGLGFQYNAVTAWNSSNVQIFPTVVEFINTNTTRLTFAVVQSGGALVTKVA